MNGTPSFVLVHGAWHGGWAWWKVRRLLQEAGTEVFTPTLTGLGERFHLAGPEVDLSTHIEDIVAVLELEDLTEVVLVGHSYGGNVITGVAERVPDRLAHLVYMDGFVPKDGESLLDLMSPAVRQEFEMRVQTEGDGWFLPGRYAEPWETALRDHYGVTDEADLARMVPRMRSQPYQTFTEPLRVADQAAAALPRTYIRCTQYPNPALSRYAEAARRPDSSWQYRELEASHDGMVSRPRELTELLLELAGTDHA
jgi:pimeloyl-ACP methyl ester carboxylesterase